jgi:large subunit ribosomal protein L24
MRFFAHRQLGRGSGLISKVGRRRSGAIGIMHIRKDDIVEVITGDDAGGPKARTTAKVLRVLLDENKIVVEGINKVYKHLKPNRQNSQGGRLSREMPIDVSNVMLYCAACRRGVRVGRRYTSDGSKERYCKNCSVTLGKLSKARAQYAKKNP